MIFLRPIDSHESTDSYVKYAQRVYDLVRDEYGSTCHLKFFGDTTGYNLVCEVPTKCKDGLLLLYVDDDGYTGRFINTVYDHMVEFPVGKFLTFQNLVDMYNSNFFEVPLGPEYDEFSDEVDIAFDDLLDQLPANETVDFNVFRQFYTSVNV